jgi:hypothetical protein
VAGPIPNNYACFSISFCLANADADRILNTFGIGFALSFVLLSFSFIGMLVVLYTFFHSERILLYIGLVLFGQVVVDECYKFLFVSFLNTTPTSHGLHKWSLQFCLSQFLDGMFCRIIRGKLKEIDAVAEADRDRKIMWALYSAVSVSLGFGILQGFYAAYSLPLEY